MQQLHKYYSKAPAAGRETTAFGLEDVLENKPSLPRLSGSQTAKLAIDDARHHICFPFVRSPMADAGGPEAQQELLKLLDASCFHY